MVIDINLLPQKERKSKAFFISIIVLIFFAIASLVAALFYLNAINNKMERVESDLNYTQLLISQEQLKLDEVKGNDSLSELERTVSWAEQYPIKTIPLIKKLTSLLPERGFIQGFSYQEMGEVTLTVQFDTPREAAYYLKNLLDSDWIQDAFLNSIKTEKLADDQQSDSDGEENVSKDEEKENILPRYIGDYRIVLNKDVIKQDEQKNESSNRGGEDS